MQTNSANYFANSAISQTPNDSHKRSYGSTFSTAAYDQAQKSGARPNSYAQRNVLYADDVADDEEDFRLGTEQYKRADGTPMFRKITSTG